MTARALFHEAGHAVAAVRLFGPDSIDHVAVSPDGTGHVEPRPNIASTPPAVAVFYLAGLAGAYVHDPIGDDWRAGGLVDVGAAWKRAMDAARGDEAAADRWHTARWAEAVELARSEWSLLSRIAVALAERRELTGADVRALVPSAMPGAPAPIAHAVPRAPSLVQQWKPYGAVVEKFIEFGREMRSSGRNPLAASAERAA